MSDTNYFHFTLGPVQGFVSQARRTRDFWAGSFILSWLAAVAIKSVEAQGGKVEFPHADPTYMSWLVGERKDDMPTQGSIPNRFKSLVAAVDPETFEPGLVTKAVQEAWKALADCVWEADLGHMNLPNNTAEIWKRQVSGFWDMSWIITEDENDSAALDQRKNWRSYTPPNEAGVKCAMMDGWQELSGEEQPNRKAMNKALWSGLREHGKQGMKSDLKLDEALCAMAFIKRRFSRHFKQLDHPMQQGWPLKGWDVPSAVPSVSYMAVVHWLEQVLEQADANKLATFHDEAIKLMGEYGEWNTNIKCLDKAWVNHKWRSLDGNVFFDSFLENKHVFDDQEQAKKVQVALNALRASCVKKGKKIPPATPFYAVLMMDGDSLGIHMSNPDKHYSITTGLAEFTQKVPGIVANNNGFLIYAGGDDVLAVLPLEDAIPCATKLREHYLECFKAKAATDNEEERLKIDTTLSGAIEFAHIKMPLTKVLKDAHQLLDDVAKDKYGRDALAIRVWKPGGLQIEWAQPWEIALKGSKKGLPIICELAADFQKNTDKDADFSSKFFFKIHERLSLLNPTQDSQKKYQPSILKAADATALMTMEYLNSWGSSKNKDAAKATEVVGKLLDQCRPIKRDIEKPTQPEVWGSVNGNDVDGNDVISWEADGALLVRFLANKGVEKQ